MSSFFKQINTGQPEPTTKKRLFKKYLPILGIVFLVLLIAGGAYAVLNQKKSGHSLGLGSITVTPTKKPAASPTAIPTPSLVPSLLTGTLVAKGSENLRPLGVMIENSPDARPQYGLGQAGLVYEAIAEGGITRFLALYENASQAIRVEPVRSARPYYVDLSNEVYAFYAHAGGSVLGLSRISQSGAYDIDGLTLGSLFKRDTTRKVSSEHTLYSSTDLLWKYATETRKWPSTTDFSPWLFQDDIAAASRPTGQTIKVSVSSPLYATQWNYDPTTNSYNRLQAGKDHIDAGTNKLINVKNVVLQTVVRTASTESYGSIVKPINLYTLTGTGEASIIQNGTVIKGTWKKASNEVRTRFYDSTGKEISFVRGTTWVQLVESGSSISL